MILDMIGGYGEHGRNCFLVYFDQQPLILLDCGIMDTDSNPYPPLNKEIIENLDYVLITHCHKDHVGAFQFLLDHGFQGVLLTTQMTYQLAKLSYANVQFLDMNDRRINIGDIEVTYGRSGHCPGSIWLNLKWKEESLLYSGDYQADSYLYITDKIEGNNSTTAIIDLAHESTMEDAQSLRNQLMEQMEQLLAQGKKIILPVQKYGRGLDMLALLTERFGKRYSISYDETFYRCGQEMLKEDFWYKKKIELKENQIGNSGDLWLVADTHLEKEINRQQVQHFLDNNGIMILSGRLKKGSFTQDHFNRKEKTIMMKYPHHQSQADFKKMVEMNHFQTIYPFHNNQKKIITQSL